MSDTQEGAATNESTKPGSRRVHAVGIYAIVILGLVLAIVIAIRRPAAQTRDIQTRFQESLVEIKSNNGDVLEVATYKSTAHFSQSDKLDTSVLGLKLPLGTTQAFLSVPVSYRFHVLLSDKWQISSTPEVVTVVAPEVRPSLPPAPDVSAMQVMTDRGWARFNEKEVENRLRSMVTGQLNIRAHKAAASPKIRDAAKRSIEKALKEHIKWLPAECKDKVFVVKFADEKAE